MTSVGKLKCFSVQLVLVQKRNLRLQITIARWMHNYTLLHPCATFDSDAILILKLTPYNWVFTVKLGTPNGAGNVILQQLTCVCLIGWELNYDFFECFLKILNSMRNMPLRHKSLVHSRNRRLCWQRPSLNTCFSSEIDLIMKWPSLLHDSGGRCVSMIYFSCIRLYHLVVLLQNLL